MKKYVKSLAFIVFLLNVNCVTATIYDITSGSFTTYSPVGEPIFLINDDVRGTYDDVTGIMDIESDTSFFGLNWSADGIVYTGPGTFSSITITEDQWLGHFLFDYGATLDTDVFNVWDVLYNPDGSIELSSIDIDGDGIPGMGTTNGATVGFSYNFDLSLTPQPVPVPAAVWLFGSGLIGLFGFVRKNKNIT